jgi:hypothetical protein
VNRAELAQRLVELREDAPRGLDTRLGELIVEVMDEWHEALPLTVVTVDDDGAGFLAAEVRSWRVEPKYGAKGGEGGCHTLVYFRGIEHAQSFNGDLHDALSSALRGGRK